MKNIRLLIVTAFTILCLVYNSAYSKITMNTMIQEKSSHIINIDKNKSDTITLNFEDDYENSNGLFHVKTKLDSVNLILEGRDAFDFRLSYNKKLKIWIVQKGAIIFKENIKNEYKLKLIASYRGEILYDILVIIRIRNSYSRINNSILWYLSSKNYL